MTQVRSVLCVGRIYCDLVFREMSRLPRYGTEVFAGGLSLHAGGGAGITAAHLAALGRPVLLAGVLPADPFGPLVTRDFVAAGVDVSLCRPAEAGQDPQITAALAGDSDRAFVTRRCGAAIPELTPDELRHVAHIHIGELSTLSDAPWLLDLAGQLGATVSSDCAWEDDLDPGVAALLARLDVFLPNADEADFLAQKGVSGPWGKLDVTKRGAEGSAASDGTVLATQRLTPVDTTGAGDAFNAGFLHGWLEGRPMWACLDLGNRQAAHAIMTPGGFAPQSQEAAQ